MTGTGAGTIELTGGTLNVLPSAAFNFPNGLFQWTGGNLIGMVTNANAMTLSSSNPVSLNRSSLCENMGLVEQTNAARFSLQLNASFENAAASTYVLSSPAGIASDDYGPQYFDNYGTFRQVGTNNAAITSVLF